MNLNLRSNKQADSRIFICEHERLSSGDEEELKFKKLFVTLVAVLAVTLNVSVAFAQSSGQDIGSIISSMFSHPYSILIFIIEFALGLGLGYFSLKVVKYILALIVIFIIGVLLSIWALPNVGGNIISSLGSDWSTIYPVIASLFVTFGLTTVLPITLGFIIGIIIAIV